MGLGFAAMRDVISFLRYERPDAAGNENPLAFAGLPETAISIGISQSGRMLRDLLYLGFNEDVRGRIVFDGMHPDIAGSRKTFTNYAFSQPGRWQKQHEDHFFPGDQFPFTYARSRDPDQRADRRPARALLALEHVSEDRSHGRRGGDLAGALLAHRHGSARAAISSCPRTCAPT
jgi:hypothetical protein